MLFDFYSSFIFPFLQFLPVLLHLKGGERNPHYPCLNLPMRKDIEGKRCPTGPRIYDISLVK